MSLFNKFELERIAKENIKAPNLMDYIKSRINPTILIKLTKETEDGDEPESVNIGKVSFTKWTLPHSKEVRLLVKNKYRRKHDYDMWIDLRDSVIYITDANNPYFKDEKLGIYNDLKNIFDKSFSIVTDHFPSDKFRLGEIYI